MNVTILGTGGIGLAYTVFLAAAGHDVTLWSPSGRGTAVFTTEAVIARGALEGEARPRIHTDIGDAIAGADAIILALRGNAHRTVIDRLVPHLRGGQAVIISSQYSLGSLYLAKRAHQRGIDILIAAWGTTAITGHRAGNTVNVPSIRKQIDVAAIPATDTPKAIALCTALFGDRFEPRDDVLAIALSNLNPPVHMADCLCNLSRMERAEDWDLYGMITPSVARLIEGLDQERLALAASFGLAVRSIYQHFVLSYHLPLADTLYEMLQTLHSRRTAPGPKTVIHRHIDEDMPFGIYPLVKIGELAQQPMSLHGAGVAIMSGLRGRDFAGENDLLPGIDFSNMTAQQLHTIAKEGWK